MGFNHIQPLDYFSLHVISLFIMSYAFSATIIVGTLVFADGMIGITAALTTRSPSTPMTLKIKKESVLFLVVYINYNLLSVEFNACFQAIIKF